MKSYITPDRIQWVGKAWEIRYALRQAQRQKGGEARLADLLPPAMPAPPRK
ncbi:Z-ring formation inhibitor MciZ [Cohnella lubricantis]|uniref:Z-ring formation inhibitor MciZ n=1 Tax=Cohnella lubricantis TaxID=2163172 RepID=A0A841TCD2_9BACL|nr:Z-ring formation inhibitor MciZ [Cohnella lubricantis]MBB6677675.1 Z-ring formation inhibitor MciZ [Cohnella lubricantis]